MSKLAEAGFRGVAGAATGAGVASAIAGLALPTVPPLALVAGAIAALVAMQAGKVFEAPDEPLIAPSDTQPDQSAS